MAGRLARGELWLREMGAPDKRRPVLVLSRPSLLRALDTVIVASVTSTRRGSPTEVSIGPAEGLEQDSCVNLSNVFTVRQSELRHFVGTVGRDTMARVCAALRIAVGCD